MKKRLAIALIMLGAVISIAQTNFNFTNSILYTQRWTSAVAVITTKPADTNSPWVVSFNISQSTNPVWASYFTNNITITYGASHFASVIISNSEIATRSGLTVSQLLNQSYFTISTQVMDAAKKKLNDEFSRRP